MVARMVVLVLLLLSPNLEASCRLSRGVPKVIVVAVSISPNMPRPLGIRRLFRSTLQHSLFEVGLSSF